MIWANIRGQCNRCNFNVMVLWTLIQAGTCSLLIMYKHVIFPHSSKRRSKRYAASLFRWPSGLSVIYVWQDIYIIKIIPCYVHEVCFTNVAVLNHICNKLKCNRLVTCMYMIINVTDKICYNCVCTYITGIHVVLTASIQIGNSLYGWSTILLRHFARDNWKNSHP